MPYYQAMSVVQIMENGKAIFNCLYCILDKSFAKTKDKKENLKI